MGLLSKERMTNLDKYHVTTAFKNRSSYIYEDIFNQYVSINGISTESDTFYTHICTVPRTCKSNMTINFPCWYTSTEKSIRNCSIVYVHKVGLFDPFYQWNLTQCEKIITLHQPIGAMFVANLIFIHVGGNSLNFVRSILYELHLTPFAVRCKSQWKCS